MRPISNHYHLLIYGVKINRFVEDCTLIRKYITCIDPTARTTITSVGLGRFILEHIYHEFNLFLRILPSASIV